MSPRRYLQRRFAKRTDFLDRPALRWLGHRLHDPNLWHLGRRSVAGAMGLGFFLAFIPIPIHMVVAAIVALVCRVNLPIIMTAIWITNPVTWVPMFYFAYRIGLFLTGAPAAVGSARLLPSVAEFSALFDQIWWPLCVGSLACGVVAGLVGYFGVELLWRVHLVRRIKQRALRRSGHREARRSDPSAPPPVDRG